MIVTGKIIDRKTKEPMWMVHVVVINSDGSIYGQTPIATVSDNDGKFNINVPSGKAISASHIGYKKEIALFPSSNMVFQMSESATTLGEFVVTANKKQKGRFAMSLGIGILAATLITLVTKTA